jgi:signal transduction histidine kinase/CheY-like chemotaxis protein/CHASE3 domain sensor protein
MKNAASITQQLRTVFRISGALLLLSSIAAFVSVQGVKTKSDLVNHTYDVLIASNAVLSAVRQAETDQRGYLLTHNGDFLQKFNGAYRITVDRYNKIKKLTEDNNTQQTHNLPRLKALIDRRFEQFRKVVEAEMNGTASTDQRNVDLLKGKSIMDSIQTAVTTIEDMEDQLLTKRSSDQETYLKFAPPLIIATGLIAILITLYSYLRMKKDLEERVARQVEEERKYGETTRRIAVMEGVTRKLAGGDYDTRSLDDREDELGRIAKALNEMAGSLQKNFTELETKAWHQEGALQLSNVMRGESDLAVLADKICKNMAGYLQAPVAALYIVADEEQARYAGGYATSAAQPVINLKEGLVKEALLSQKLLQVNEVPPDYLRITSALGSTAPACLLVVPLILYGRPLGFIEIGLLQPPAPPVIQWLGGVTESVAISINSNLSLQRISSLLEETQAQSEELKAQHVEMEKLNGELEMQAQKLQASEEELRVQQEELLQTNSELEERSRLLEEKNQTIVERNLEIQQKVEDLAVSTRYKSEFLANMSHELRTPLNSILLLSRLLADNNEKNLSGDEVEYAKVIQSSGNGLLSLIDEILDLSKIEAGKMELEYTQVPVAEIMEDMKSLFSPIAKERGVLLQLNIEEGLPQSIETDKMRMEQILKNLISNALKFTAKGSVTINAFSVRDDGATTIGFAVKDTGIGIAKEAQGSIFEAFQQADGSTRRKYGGTGLGLSISRELARLLRGKITVSSEPGKGSEFTLYVPRQKAAEAEQGRPELAPEPVAESSKAEASLYHSITVPENLPDDRDTIRAGDKTVLIIEDDAAFARALLEFARKNAYKGIVAVRGDEGIQLARQYLPAGILLDIQLPVKSGWEVMEELKNDSRTRPIPVHIMSSHNVKKESLVKGAVDFIDKPLAFEQIPEIFNRIEQILNKENKKVLIVEENTKHARALAYYLESYKVNAQVARTIGSGMDALKREAVDCVILDMGIPDTKAYETLETLKGTPGFENLPIIIFTGKSLSRTEELKIKQYADAIVIKTAQSYHRILDEVSLFLHLVEESKAGPEKPASSRLSILNNVLKDKKILIADDDVRNIFSLSKALEANQMSVFTAVDGKEALKQLELSGADVVLMDIMMPEMDGYETMRRIRSEARYRSLPIIAVTAKAMSGDREKCIQAGASDYISKPVDVDQLLSLLRVWLYDQGM